MNVLPAHSTHLSIPGFYPPANEMAFSHSPPSHQVQERKRANRDAKLKPFRPAGALNVELHFTEKERSILRGDATVIADMIRKRVYTSFDVLKAFVKAAIAAQDATNCLSEICFEEAFTRAKELDDHLAETGEVVGPLHGVPVSIKDHIKVKGLDTSTGYTGGWTPQMGDPMLTL